MSFAISPVDSTIGSFAASDFSSTVDAVIALSDANHGTTQPGAAVTFADTSNAARTGSITTHQDTDSSSSTIISVSTGAGRSDPDDALSQVTEQTAVIVKKSDDGLVEDAAIISITTNADDATKTISITKKNDDNTTQTSTITLDSLRLSDDPNVAYASVLTNLDTGLPQSMFLISSGDPGAGQSDVFLVSLINSADTIDISTSFANGGFTTFSGRDGFQSFGGAVSIDVGGQKIIIWLDAGRAIANGFSGVLSANFGTFAPDTSLASSTVSGEVMQLDLIFEHGRISEIWDGDVQIDDLDAFARETAENAPQGEIVDQETIAQQRGTIVSNAPLFSFRVGAQTDAVNDIIDDGSIPDERRQIDPLNWITDLIQQSKRSRLSV